MVSECFLRDSAHASHPGICSPFIGTVDFRTIKVNLIEMLIFFFFFFFFFFFWKRCKELK